MVVRTRQRRAAMALTPQRDLVDAYDHHAEAWSNGPDKVYRQLARVLIDASPIDVEGATVLDLGAGTGAASHAAFEAGAARVTALDIAAGMLRVDRHHRPPPVLGDLASLPFADAAFDLIVAAFSLNHIANPVPAIVEAQRVTRRSGAIVISAFSGDDVHPVREAVETAARSRGWRPPSWYSWFRTDATACLADVGTARAAMNQASMPGCSIAQTTVEIVGLSPSDLVAWRCGMAHLAPFFAALPGEEREDLVHEALHRLGPNCPPLVRSMVIVTAQL